jgi:hypothetical protein
MYLWRKRLTGTSRGFALLRVYYTKFRIELGQEVLADLVNGTSAAGLRDQVLANQRGLTGN